MDFNEKIKLIRKTLNISQEMLARELNLSFATINRLENGKTLPTYDTMEKVNKFCVEKGISFDNRGTK